MEGRTETDNYVRRTWKQLVGTSLTIMPSCPFVSPSGKSLTVFSKAPPCCVGRRITFLLLVFILLPHHQYQPSDVLLRSKNRSSLLGYHIIFLDYFYFQARPTYIYTLKRIFNQLSRNILEENEGWIRGRW